MKRKSAIGFFSKFFLGTYFLWGATSFGSTYVNKRNDLTLSNRDVLSKKMELIKEKVNNPNYKDCNYFGIVEELMDKNNFFHRATLSFSVKEVRPSHKSLSMCNKELLVKKMELLSRQIKSPKYKNEKYFELREEFVDRNGHSYRAVLSFSIAQDTKRLSYQDRISKQKECLQYGQVNFLRTEMNRPKNKYQKDFTITTQQIDRNHKLSYRATLSFSARKDVPADKTFSIDKNVQNGDVLIYEKNFDFCLTPHGTYRLKFDAYNRGWFYGNYFRLIITFETADHGSFYHSTKKLFSEKGTHRVSTEGSLMNISTSLREISFIKKIKKVRINLLPWEEE